MDGAPHYVWGFCNIDKSPEELLRREQQRAYFGAGYDPTRTHTAHAAFVASAGNFSIANLAWLGDDDPCRVLDRLGLVENFRVRHDGFMAFALGNIDDDPDLDVWSIDDHKVIRHDLRD